MGTPRIVNLERLDTWVIKDHTQPKDLKFSIPVGAGTWDHAALFNRNNSDQHIIGAITGLQDALDSKVNIADLAIINCGTSTEVI